MHEQGAVGASIPGTVPVGIPSTSSEGVVFPRNNRIGGFSEGTGAFMAQTNHQEVQGREARGMSRPDLMTL
jgi:hypothetical protein